MANVPLKPGQNVIRVLARDAAGNTSTAELTVTGNQGNDRAGR